MKSAESMHSSARCTRHGLAVFAAASILAVLSALLAGGCAAPPRTDLIAPYHAAQTWAVVPPLNESGVSIVDTAHIADMLAHELQQVDGVDMMPVNRTLAAMRRAGLQAVLTDGDAFTLMNLLNADGLLVGSVTAWDPYPPPTLGLAVQLYLRTGGAGGDEIDPVAVSRTTRGEVAPGQLRSIEAVARAAGVFSARDQPTLAQLDRYAATRHLPGSAYGNDEYLVSMDLYTKFVSHLLIRDLLQDERFRLTRVVASTERR